MKNKYQVIITRQAQQDVLRIIGYYNQQQQGLGKKFATELQKKFRQLRNAPYASSVVHGNKIFPSLKKFPFYIGISVDAQLKVITIWAIIHHKQNHENWL